MLRITAFAAALAVGATAVFAQNVDVISTRMATMKSIGNAMKAPGAMRKGETPFDLSVVQASLKTVIENAPKAKALFPDDSKTGHDTAALAVIWEKKDDFFPRFDKLAADATAAMTSIKDEATFKTEWPKIGANCGGCHKVYRKPD